MADTRNRIGGWRIESRRLGVAVVLGLLGLLLGCASFRQNGDLFDIAEDVFWHHCLVPAETRTTRGDREAPRSGEACRKSRTEKGFRDKLLSETRAVPGFDRIRDYLVAQGFTCEEKRTTTAKTLACEFLYERIVPKSEKFGERFDANASGLFRWAVAAEETWVGKVSVDVKIEKLEGKS